MARSVTTSSLFSATAMGAVKKDRPFRHVTDSEFARSLAMKQQVQGVSSPHSAKRGDGPPVKRVKK